MAHRHRFPGSGSPRQVSLRLRLWGVLLLAGTALSESPSRPRTESLAYEVFWGGMLVGRARIEVVPTTDSSQFVVRTTAKANETIQSWYPVRDTVESWVSVGTGLPVRFHKRLNEGSYSASVLMNFDRTTKVVRVRGGQKKGGSPDTLVEIPPDVHDLLSAFQAIRAADLAPGASVQLPIVDNRKVFSSVEIACLRRESLETDHGTFKTLVIEPRLHGDALFKSKGKLRIWLTDDDRRMPVLMKSEIKLGTIRAELVSHSP